MKITIRPSINITIKFKIRGTSLIALLLFFPPMLDEQVDVWCYQRPEICEYSTPYWSVSVAGSGVADAQKQAGDPKIARSESVQSLTPE